MTTASEKRRPRGAGKLTGEVMTIRCAFCAGTGRDPYEILSNVSNCPVCKGHKTVPVETPTVVCAYCRGAGRQRHTRLTCSACGGAGVITLPGPTDRCPQCDGSGREPEADLPCSLCRGVGLVAKKTTQEKERPAAREGREES